MKETSVQPKPFLQIHFSCCNVYQRIYKDMRRNIYQGRCPRCLRSLTIKVGDSGVSSRTFIAQ